MADPVSWLQIAQGWSVVTSDGVILGTVAQVEGDKQNDIFDGLAVEPGNPPRSGTFRVSRSGRSIPAR